MIPRYGATLEDLISPLKELGYSSILDALSKINVDLDLQLTGGKKMPRNGIKQPKLVKQPAINWR